MLWWIVGGVTVVGVLGAVVAMRRRAGGALTSLVLLRNAPGAIDEARVRERVRSLFKEAGGVLAMPRMELPDGMTQGLAVTLNGGPVFYIIASSRPYVPDPAEQSQKFADPKQRAAFGAHRAWVSVDVVGGAPDPEMRDVVMASLLVIALCLVDAQTTLVYSTWLDRAALPGDLGKAAGPGGIDAVFR